MKREMDKAESLKKEHYQSRENTISTIEMEQDPLKQNMDKLQEENASLKRKLTDLNKELEISVSQKSARDYALLKYLSFTLQKYDECQYRLHELETECVSLQEIIGEKDQLLERLENVVALEAEQTNDLRKENDKLKHWLEELQEILEEITAQREMYKEKHEQFNTLDTEVKSLREMVKCLKDKERGREILTKKVTELQILVDVKNDEIQYLFQKLELNSTEKDHSQVSYLKTST